MALPGSRLNSDQCDGAGRWTGSLRGPADANGRHMGGRPEPVTSPTP